MMKRRKIALLVLTLAVLLFVGAFLFHPSSPYNVPFSEGNVKSISFYYGSEAKKKIVTSSSDISSVLDSLNEMNSHGEYKRMPAGGSSFNLVFHLQDESDWICTYFQTNGDTGFYTHGTVRIKVSHLDLKALWSLLPYQEVTAYVEQEITPPAL